MWGWVPQRSSLEGLGSLLAEQKMSQLDERKMHLLAEMYLLGEMYLLAERKASQLAERMMSLLAERKMSQLLLLAEWQLCCLQW